MSLKSVFSEQIDALREFMADPSQTMRAVRYEPDVEPLLEKILVKLDDDDDNPHVMVVCRCACHSRSEYFQQLLDEVVEQNERHRKGLSEVGVELPRPAADVGADSGLEQYVSAVADCLPSWLGSYVIVLYPEEITDEESFKSVAYSLLASSRTELAKYMVFDRQSDPILDDLAEQSPRASVQVFEFSPDEIQKRIAEDLQGDALSPQERLKYVAMAGSFALAKKDFAEAEKMQLQALEMARQQESVGDEAAGHYNLGNTYLAEDKIELAQQHFSQAVEIGIDQEMHSLVAMALTNFGIALHRGGDTEQSLESFDVARQTFQAVNNPPGIAVALDNKAQVLHHEGRNEEAEQAWLEALSVYDGITAVTFSKLRETGRQDIRAKLEEFYQATGQAHKSGQLQV